MADHRPLKPALRAATFVSRGKVFEVNLDTKQMNCPNCGLRMWLPHDLLTEPPEGGIATASPSVVCPPDHGGCGSHVVIQRENAV